MCGIVGYVGKQAAAPLLLEGLRRLEYPEAETFLASDVSPIVAHTRKVVYLEDGDVVTVTPDGLAITAQGKPTKRAVSTVDWSAEGAELGGFPHYMLKEIHEQPDRVDRNIQLSGPLTAEQQRRLLEIADRCPIHRTLTSEIDIRTQSV
jgi:glucosamine--fructose-6-phosphate aminotransferase (isomerizing)